jgi:hypothetical protein
MGGVLQDTHLAFIVLFSEDRTDQIILELLLISSQMCCMVISLLVLHSPSDITCKLPELMRRRILALDRSRNHNNTTKACYYILMV